MIGKILYYVCVCQVIKLKEFKLILLGYDIGSSSVKASILDGESGTLIAAAFQPRTEMEINAPHTGWAEQDPDTWWKNLCLAGKRADVQC